MFSSDNPLEILCDPTQLAHLVGDLDMNDLVNANDLVDLSADLCSQNILGQLERLNALLQGQDIADEVKTMKFNYNKCKCLTIKFNI